MAAIVLVSTGSDPVVYEHLLPGSNLIGRDPSARIKLSSTKASRTHCIIYWAGSSFWVEDYSANGTALNGRLLQRGASHPLVPGDVLTAADTRLELRLTDETIPPMEDPRLPARRRPVGDDPGGLGRGPHRGGPAA